MTLLIQEIDGLDLLQKVNCTLYVTWFLWWIYVQREEIFVSLELVEDDPYAPTRLIKELTEDYICLNNFTSNGEANGFSYIAKEDVHKLFIDSLPEQDITLIYHNLNI